MDPKKNNKKKIKKKKRKFNPGKVLADIILSYEVLISSLDDFKEINIKKKEDIYKFAYFGYLLKNEIAMKDEGRKKLADAVSIAYEEMVAELNIVSKHPVWRYAFCYLVTADLLGDLNERKVNMVLDTIERDIEKVENVADNIESYKNSTVFDIII